MSDAQRETRQLSESTQTISGERSDFSRRLVNSESGEVTTFRMSDTRNSSRPPVHVEVSSLTPPPALFQGATKPAGNPAGVFLAGIFALTGVGALYALAGHIEVGRPARPVQAALPAMVDVSLHSVPEGAMVLIDDKSYGPTPIDIKLSAAEAQEGRELTFYFMREGYREAVVTQRVHGPTLEVLPPHMALVEVDEAPGSVPKPDRTHRSRSSH